MRGAWAIMKRELLSYFHSPVAYVAIVVFLLLRAIAFAGQLLLLLQFQATQQAQNLEAEQVLRDMYGSDVVWALLLIVPLLTMRLLSEERSQHTAELLLTAPISTTQIVLGKFLAALIVVAVMVLFGLGIPVLFIAYTGASWLPVIAGIGATLLFGAVLIGVGLLASSLTESQFVAAMLGVAFNLILYLFGSLVTKVPLIGASLDQFSVLTNLEHLGRGVVDTSAILFFVTTSALFLFLTSRLLDSQRWR
jgi:ABC-2 type transport system permease protein